MADSYKRAKKKPRSGKSSGSDPEAYKPRFGVKHAILQTYLEAWFPILSSYGATELTYLDGYAGAGEFEVSKEEMIDGAPLRILNSLKNHILRGRIARVNLIFNDQNKHEILKGLLAERARDAPSDLRVNFTVHDKEFTTFFDDWKNDGDQSKHRVFAFIDPWGMTSTESVVDVLEMTQGEVLVNFMFTYLVRFVNSAQHQEQVSKVYMTGDEGLQLPDGFQTWNPLGRRSWLIQEYIRTVSRRVRGKEVYACEFRMFTGEKNYPTYALIHFSTHPKGCDLMKKAMWKQRTEHEKKKQTPMYAELGYWEKLSSDTSTGFSEEEHKVVVQRIVDRFSNLDDPRIDGETIKEFILRKTPFPFLSTTLTKYLPRSGHVSDISLSEEGALKGDNVSKAQFTFCTESRPTLDLLIAEHFTAEPTTERFDWDGFYTKALDCMLGSVYKYVHTATTRHETVIFEQLQKLHSENRIHLWHPAKTDQDQPTKFTGAFTTRQKKKLFYTFQ